MADEKSSKLHPNTKDISGQRFGRLTVLRVSHSRKVPKYKGTRLYWVCRCDCGNDCTVEGPSLRNGDTQSCGCFHVQRTKEASTTHGLSDSTEFDIWNSMIQRCHNPKSHAYSHYGGRGIQVCDRWRYSFETFLADMGRRPANLSLDRINNDGNYEPGNVRWATPLQQARNQRRNKMIKHNGVTLTLSEWSERSGIKAATIYWRYHNGRPLFTKLYPNRH